MKKFRCNNYYTKAVHFLFSKFLATFLCTNKTKKVVGKKDFKKTSVVVIDFL